MFTKKQKIKKVRNVLESPFYVQQWTGKSQDELIPLKNELKKLLPAAKLEQVALKKRHWKKQNEEATNEVLTKGKQPNIYRKLLAPGFQSVVRGLERGDLCCVILAGNITPVLLQRVVLACAHVNSVPVTVVSDLKTITKSALGFPTMVLGFKNVVVDPENKFSPIYNLVSQNKIKFDITLSNVEEDVSMDQTICVSESLKPQQIKAENVYLLRNHTGERAFVPGLKPDKNDKIIIKRDSENVDDFISLKKEITENISRCTSKNEVFDLKDISDDSDSDIDNIVFVDTKQDASLLVTKSADHNIFSTTNISKSSKPKFNNKAKKGISYNMSNIIQIGTKDDSNSTNSNVLQNMKHTTKKNKVPSEVQSLKGYNTSKTILGKQKSQYKMHTGHSSHVNFNPLKIKSIAHNLKKIKRKKKN